MLLKEIPTGDGLLFRMIEFFDCQSALMES
jgi:hypothetical protein